MHSFSYSNRARVCGFNAICLPPEHKRLLGPCWWFWHHMLMKSSRWSLTPDCTSTLVTKAQGKPVLSGAAPIVRAWNRSVALVSARAAAAGHRTWQLQQQCTPRASERRRWCTAHCCDNKPGHWRQSSGNCHVWPPGREGPRAWGERDGHWRRLLDAKLHIHIEWLRIADSQYRSFASRRLA